jgi:hypothetical protein
MIGNDCKKEMRTTKARKAISSSYKVMYLMVIQSVKKNPESDEKQLTLSIAQISKMITQIFKRKILYLLFPCE